MKPKEKERGEKNLNLLVSSMFPDSLSAKLSCFAPDSNQDCKQLLLA